MWLTGALSPSMSLLGRLMFLLGLAETTHTRSRSLAIVVEVLFHRIAGVGRDAVEARGATKAKSLVMSLVGIGV